MARLTTVQKGDMETMNIELNKLFDTNINFKKLSYKDLSDLFEKCIKPGQLAICIGRYKAPGIIRQLLNI